jgi:hypothetical protein
MQLRPKLEFTFKYVLTETVPKFISTNSIGKNHSKYNLVQFILLKASACNYTDI